MDSTVRRPPGWSEPTARPRVAGRAGSAATRPSRAARLGLVRPSPAGQPGSLRARVHSPAGPSFPSTRRFGRGSAGVSSRGSARLSQRRKGPSALASPIPLLDDESADHDRDRGHKFRTCPSTTGWIESTQMCIEPDGERPSSRLVTSARRPPPCGRRVLPRASRRGPDRRRSGIVGTPAITSVTQRQPLPDALLLRSLQVGRS
jgi:hypothetical protein